ncbi:MAG: DUF3017 domain-containing protein [Dermatophilaceae bacterium]|jgi:hypothetical protein|nr:DUF3017 domain-containing protein [Actinomycetales bacterium]MBP8880793.1 DUF3017 domain-containing protein [Dermatophilaceae bacterium]MBP9918962.1 DUF3017 domain-containing protein [Dermatophilaceae bacterium]
MAITGIVLSAAGRLRLGCYVFALSLLVAAIARVTVKSPGGLAVRRRSVDVVCYLGLAAAVALAGTLVRLDVP